MPPSAESPAAAQAQLTQLLSVATVVLHQGLYLVDNVLTSDDQLTIRSKYVTGSTIGKHLRHVRDHFELLVRCISLPPPHTLSYDNRPRNTPMESSLRAARQSILDTIASLEKNVPTATLDDPITLSAVTPHEQIFQSTFGRELWFAILHAIHHWSTVRVVAGELGLKVEDDFGYAPSTLVHQRRGKPFEFEKARF